MSFFKAIKYSGAGNTIVLIEGNKVNPKGRKVWAQKICSAKGGMNSDGVLFLEKDTDGSAIDYVWDFYNSDGSQAEMCGNAARCATQFCREELGIKKDTIAFKTLAGIVSCKNENNQQIAVQMPPIKILSDQIKLVSKNLPETVEVFFFVDTGVPHLVVEKNSEFFLAAKTNEPSKQKWAQIFRKHQDLGAKGANVTIVSQTQGLISAITYERGVEKFTLACGTGAVAAAAYLLNKGKREDKVDSHQRQYEIHMPGGMLRVDLSNTNKPLLIGDSKKIIEADFQEN